jgi:hypothetical protein
MFDVLPVRRSVGRINGKHKTDNLCALCGSAVKKLLYFKKRCENIYCRIGH